MVHFIYSSQNNTTQFNSLVDTGIDINFKAHELQIAVFL
jgi:hypothetical protein